MRKPVTNAAGGPLRGEGGRFVKRPPVPVKPARTAPAKGGFRARTKLATGGGWASREPVLKKRTPKPKTPTKPKNPRLIPPKPSPTTGKPAPPPPRKLLRGRDGRFRAFDAEIDQIERTTAEFREDFYKPLGRKKADLEERARSTPDGALKSIQTLLARVARGLTGRGLGSRSKAVKNRDGSVDGEIIVGVVAPMVAATDKHEAGRRLLQILPNIIGRLPAEIWFSVRDHFQTPYAVDEHGDRLIKSDEYDKVTPSLYDPKYVLAKHRWDNFALTTAWQRTQQKFYSNVTGATAILKAMLNKYAYHDVTFSDFTLKLSWNKWLITPGKTR